ncbi:MAG: gliding motility-associated C-terminal domain-containing protein [Leadbetterella sp.]
MRFSIRLVFVLILGLMFTNINCSYATHIRAGEITARRISATQLTYRITLTTYTDEVNGKGANDSETEVNFYFGFTTTRVELFKVRRKKKFPISPSTICNVYDTVYTFPASGNYRISCGIVNRNARTINLGSSSDQISFFVSSNILIDPNIGLNSTPVLLNIPIDSASTGNRFVHNPGAFDIDGDSLSYKLTIPQKDIGAESGVPEFISTYLDPTLLGTPPILNERETGPATFSINPRTGDLIWDAPKEPGQYNIAFIIEEWRRAPDGSYIRIGVITRDMQIIVVEGKNKRPEIEVPGDQCIEAGKKLEFEITGKDVDNQVLKLTSSGGVYNRDASGNPSQFIPNDPARFTTTIKAPPTKGTFSWTTNCLHTRNQVYDVLFKVEDSPGRFITPLVDIKTVKIKVTPPRATGVFATEQPTGNLVRWTQVKGCSSGDHKIMVYRKIGCSGRVPGECTSGIPADWAYTKIGETKLTDSTFLDLTASKGVTYSYRVVVQISENEFTALIGSPSAEFCIGAEVKTGSNVITNVTIQSTSTTTGKILVRWTRPIQFDSVQNKGPYSYRIYRAEGVSSENYSLIVSVPTNLSTGKLDTVFVDSLLNTSERVYKYKVEFLTLGSTVFSTSSVASSVRLTGTPENRAIALSWSANVPWDNDNNTHLIFRENKATLGNFNLIRSLSVTNSSTYVFTDNGKDEVVSDGDISTQLINGDTYCYYVITQGAFKQTNLNFGILQNSSQIYCIKPEDNSPPCPPFVESSNSTNTLIECKELPLAEYCKDETFVNKLTWNNSPVDTCKKEIRSYNIYFARYEEDTPALIGTSNVNSFNHIRNSKDGYAGCYTITAKNNFGKESKPSAKICYENCENIGFPNVFTPNGDGKNDTFSPLNCPAFINKITYTIYNGNSGSLVAEGTGDTMAWDGIDTRGNKAPTGVYYYTIVVTFEKLNKEGSTKTFKGYINLLR